jgi:hypothetical protein
VLGWRERTQTALVTATALPVLVALTEIGLRNRTMLPENAAALVGAGVLTVLLLPALAVALGRSEGGADPASVPAGESPPPAPAASREGTWTRRRGRDGG